jgi:hypothetical protein
MLNAEEGHAMMWMPQTVAEPIWMLALLTLLPWKSAAAAVGAAARRVPRLPSVSAGWLREYEAAASKHGSPL